MVLHNHITIALDSMKGMDEPLRKKLKIEEKDVEHELDLLQEHLLKNCLCSLPENILQQSFWQCDTGDVLWSSLRSDWGRDQILMLLTSIQLVFDITIRQNVKSGYICRRIVDLCNTLIDDKNNLIDYFLELADDTDQFISFSTSRALSSYILVKKSQIDQRLLNELRDSLVMCSRPRKLLFSLEVLNRVIEWKKHSDHILEDNRPEDDKPVSGCHALKITDSEESSEESLEDEPDESSDENSKEDSDGSGEQYSCKIFIDSLKSKWPEIVNRFHELILTDSHAYSSCIIRFLNLWESIISVKANLSVIDTAPFYSNLDNYVTLLSPQTSAVPSPLIPSIIWKHILNLFNEVLCYGSTLALQGTLAEEPCSLAHLIVRSVKNRQRPLLSMVPYREGSGNFGGDATEGDRVLLKKVVLLILKAIAVTVKETRYDSSSDSSSGSDMDETYADMVVIKRSIKEVLKQLDNFIKTLLPFHPETRLAQWVVQMFTDQDDYLMESMICCLDVFTGLCCRNNGRYDDNALVDLSHILNPNVTFLQFLQTVSFSSNVLLDFLISNETCFLFYFLRYLKYASRNWEEFVYSCGYQIEDVMNVLIRLRLTIERLHNKKQFPYDPKPLLKYLRGCEHFYEQTIY